MGRLEHTNKDRAFGPGEIMNANPDHKSHRKNIYPHIQDKADELYRLKTLLSVSNNSLQDIVENAFGERFGDHFLPAFLSRRYGVGFNPRTKTLIKLNYLITYLKEVEKEFASS